MSTTEGTRARAGISDRTTVVLFLVATAAGFAQFGATTALNDVARHFGHVFQSGSLQSVVGLSGSSLGLGLAALRIASLGALPLASLADRWGRTRVLRPTLLLGLIVTAVAAFSPGYWLFVLCFALARPLLAVTVTLVQVITVELSKTTFRMRRLVVMAAGDGIGSGLSAVLHGLIRGADSFRWLFALTIVPVIVIAPLLRYIPEPARGKARPSARLGFIPEEARRRLLIVGIVAFTIGFITGPSGGFTFVYAEGVLKMRPSLVAAVVVGSGVAGLLGLFASGHLARTWGRRWTVGLGVLSTAIVSAYAYGGGRTAFIVGYVLSVGAGGLLSPAMAAMSTEIFRHDFRATAAGWITVAGVTGAVAGLGLFGWVGDLVRASTSTGLRAAALVTFLPLLPTLLLLRHLPESRNLELT